MSTLLYVSDNNYYVDKDGNWYSDGIFPKEIQEVFDDVDKWVFYGRLHNLPEKQNKYLIEKGENIKTLQFCGIWNAKSGVKANLLSVNSQIRILRKELKHSDVVYMKFNYTSSYLCTLIPETWKKYTISHMVGDLDCIKYICQSKWISLVVAVRRYLYSRASKRLNLQIFVSEKLKEKYGNGYSNAVAICENRISSKIIHNAHIEDNIKLSLLFVGRLSKEKGIDVLLKALVPLGGYHLSIAGSGAEREFLEHQSKELGISNDISFLGNVQWGEPLFELMGKSDLLILPSYSEGLPLVILEAMSFGVPVIASNVGGIPEIVKNGENGYLFNAGDHQELRRLIEMALNKSINLSRMREQALITAQEYSLESSNMRLKEALLCNSYTERRR